MREQLQSIIENYILYREQLTCLFLLIDIRHEPQKIDLEFMNWLGEKGVPFALVFTKLDKITSMKVKENLKTYQLQLLTEWEELPPVFLTSSEKKSGRVELLDYIDSINKNLK